jgi:hypothetical protein
MRCYCDTCVYVKISQTGNLIIIAVFVDDIIAAYSLQDIEEWKLYKQKYMSKYSMSDIGKVEWILGMRVTRDQNKLILDQKPMIERIMQQFNLTNCISMDTPESGVKLTLQDCSTEEEHVQRKININEYQSLTGALLYLALSTRPDIAHAVNVLSRFLSHPGSAHVLAAKRVLRYLSGTPHAGLIFQNQGYKTSQEEVTITAYSDADWAGDLDDRKSTTGYIILMNGNVINWNSKKQATVALSTAEAEYMAISAAVQEIKWLVQLLTEMQIKVKLPVTLYCDNQAAISISENDVHHHRTKHIDIRHHYVRDEIRNKFIQIKWIQSNQQLADIMTKSLNKIQFQKLRCQIMNS